MKSVKDANGNTTTRSVQKINWLGGKNKYKPVSTGINAGLLKIISDDNGIKAYHVNLPYSYVGVSWIGGGHHEYYLDVKLSNLLRIKGSNYRVVYAIQDNDGVVKKYPCFIHKDAIKVN